MHGHLIATRNSNYLLNRISLPRGVTVSTITRLASTPRHEPHPVLVGTPMAVTSIHNSGGLIGEPMRLDIVDMVNGDKVPLVTSEVIVLASVNSMDDLAEAQEIAAEARAMLFE